jgi:hypothetical protein
MPQQPDTDDHQYHGKILRAPIRHFGLISTCLPISSTPRGKKILGRVDTSQNNLHPTYKGARHDARQS